MKNYNFKLKYIKYSSKRNIVKNILSIAFLAILSLVVLLYALGIRPFIIYGWSAEPFHHYGSIAIDYQPEFEDLKIGDFVTWSRNGGKSFTTHQIVEIDKINKTVTTSQQPADDPDTNRDSPVTIDQIYGKVLFSVPYIGRALVGIRDLVMPYGVQINIIGVLFVVAVLGVYYLFKRFMTTDEYVFMGGVYDKK